MGTEQKNCGAVFVGRKMGTTENEYFVCGEDCASCPLVNPPQEYAEVGYVDGICAEGHEEDSLG